MLNPFRKCLFRFCSAGTRGYFYNTHLQPSLFCLSSMLTKLNLKNYSRIMSEDLTLSSNLDAQTKELEKQASVTQSSGQANNEKAETTPPLSRNKQKKLLRAQRHKELRMKRKAENLQKAQKEDAGFNVEEFNDSEFYFEKGLRKVYPYHFVFATYAKGRWVKKKLKDILSGEFGFDHPEELDNAYSEGRIHVNNKRVTDDYVIKDKDYISHRIHRHENSVTAEEIEIIADTENVLVVNKPSSIPCHPCGRYRFNSIVFILGKELGYSNLRNIYRLDRLTSGVLILGKTPEYTRKLENQVVNREVEKEYVCRVVGKFPEGEVLVDQPLQAIYNKMRLQIVDPAGKASQTLFTRLSYNGQSSVVKCVPKTGRTHQIRVHLQWLGHPILNDGFYNSDIWGPERGKGGRYGVAHHLVIDRILAKHVATMWEEGLNPRYVELYGADDSKGGNRDGNPEESQNRNIDGKPEGSQNGNKDSKPVESDKGSKESKAESDSEEPAPKQIKLSSDSEALSKEGSNTEKKDEVDGVTGGCIKCPNGSGTSEGSQNPKRPGFDPSKMTLVKGCMACKKTYIDPSPKHLVMFLHALKYKGPGWEYETKLPGWAEADWDQDQEYTL